MLSLISSLRKEESLFDNLESLTLSHLHFRVSEHRHLEWGEPTLCVNGVYFWGPNSNVQRVCDGCGAVIGFVIGTLIDYERECVVHESIVCSASSGTAVITLTDLEEWLHRYGGRWIAVFNFAGIKRIYVDANASLGVVYDVQKKVAGSTSSAILDKYEYRERFREKVFRKLNVRHRGWFPATVTAHFGVERLLPNHFLDLRDWQQYRHWPRLSSEVESVDISLRRICDVVARHINAAVKDGAVCCSLTAGQETRTLLACSTGLYDVIDFVTIDSRGDALDVLRARELACRFNLRHTVLPEVRADAQGIEEWIFNTGHCIGGKLASASASVRPLLPYAYHIGGHGGEVCRGFLYRSGDKETDHLSSRRLLARLGLPKVRLIESAIDRWLRGLPALPLSRVLDLAYIELRMSSWGFAHSYTGTGPQEIHPLICRESYALMMGLPVAAKRTEPLARAVSLCAPELLSLPINSYGDYRDQLAFASKLANPSRVINKLYRLFG